MASLCVYIAQLYVGGSRRRRARSCWSEPLGFARTINQECNPNPHRHRPPTDSDRAARVQTAAFASHVRSLLDLCFAAHLTIYFRPVFGWKNSFEAVSYTHLTLPTICSV